jgi:UDP-N-acetylmuramoylalanine--D-glutamate ligase
VLDAGIAFAGRVRLRRDDLPLLGEHNALNLCAALTALEAARVPLPPLPGSLQGFQALPHRLQAVAHGGGVLWVNDSISTTPESTIAALASFPGRELVLIAGGQDRGQDHGELGRALAERGAAVIGVPSTGPQLLAAATGAGLSHERALPAADLTDAVAQARGLASPGAVVLLSPAAPSYDFYADFEERGQRFAALAAAPQAP